MKDNETKENLHGFSAEFRNTAENNVEYAGYDSAADRRFVNSEKKAKKAEKKNSFSDVRECAKSDNAKTDNTEEKHTVDDVSGCGSGRDCCEENKTDCMQKTLAEKRTQKRGTAFLKLSFMAVLLIMVLGVAVVQNSEMPWNVEQQLAKMSADNTQNLPEEKNNALPVVKDVENSVAVDETTEQKNETAEQNKTAEVSGNTVKWQLADSAQVIKDYGYSYDETWHDYRFHGGLDIKMPKGSTVKSIAEGKVTEISKTKALGEYLRIDYGGSLVGYYYGIDVNDSLQNGSTVKKGDSLGVVTEPPLEESSMEPHYHFALIQDGQTVDPMKFAD